MTRANRQRAIFLTCACWCAAAVVAGELPAPTAEEQPAAALAEGPVNFELDVLPVLSAAGCNAGACHGKSRGQNGFALSLLAFDPAFDYASLALEGRGRRIFSAAPDNSLVLRKASLAVPHGGGLRLKPGSAQYETVRRWIAAGAPRTPADAPRLERIEVQPVERILAPGETVQLSVLAHYSDGSTRDVTRLTDFQANEPGVVSLEGGAITAGESAGEATLMIRYMNNVATWNAAIPMAGTVDAQLYEDLPRVNFIDELVWNKLRSQGITPSGPASDSTYLRRVYLDIIGRLPSADEARAYLTSTSPAKRAELVDSLLARGEYADFWANKWADLLRPNPYRVGIKPTMAFDAWIRQQFRDNVPYDRFVRELITAQGSAWRNGAATWFRDRRTPDEITPVVSQLFLGIRLECAKCHHHPFEVWSQEDFYSLAAYFSRVAHKGEGISPPISGGEETIFVADSGEVRHPVTGKVLEPRPLFGTARPIAPGEDPRAALADWITSPENSYFAQVAVSRVWADLMGKGLVEPVDDLRATNPASNEALLAALGDDFRQQGYDLKKLIRRIVTSHVYGLSSVPNERNAADTRNYSRHYRTRLRAEVLLDAVCDITGVPEDFTGMPPGTRSIEIWTHRVGSLFLDAFGRPDANQDPPYERAPDSTIVQALHLMNSPELHKKFTSDAGRAAKLAASDHEPEQIVEELYLSVYSRFPTDEERQAVTDAFVAHGDRRAATEDLMWALVNTPEFMFKD